MAKPGTRIRLQILTLVSTSLLSSTALAFTDTDSDGMDDDWETTNFGNLARNGTADFDSDGILDLEEYTHGLDPTVDDGFDDADGDRYPNVFEIRNSSDPNDDTDHPTPIYVVNAAGGGNYTSISASVNAATTTNGQYQVISVASGTYTGSANCTINITSTKPRLLIIGAAGARTTVVDCAGVPSTWSIYKGVAFSSLTLRRFSGNGIYFTTTNQVQLSDMLVRDAATAYGVLRGSSATKIRLIGSSFVNNTSNAYFGLVINLTYSNVYLFNTVLWNAFGGTTVRLGSSTIQGNNSLAGGVTLSGTDNLASSTDAMVLSSGRPLLGSPLHGAGGTGAFSLLDLDLEARGSPPDIGVDQWVDSDSDDLPDAWELEYAVDLTILTSATGDYDGDGVTNETELALSIDPLDSDSDDDGLSDGGEVANLTDPNDVDSDDDDMPDGWEVQGGLDPTTANAYDDDDGDRYPNVFEYFGGGDPSDPQDLPTPTYVVAGSGGGTHTSLSGAVNAATTTNGSYQIIEVQPGIYTGLSNCSFSINSSKPKLLIIGTAGARATIVECAGVAYATWFFYQGVVVGSMTIRGFSGNALYFSVNKEVRLVDLVVLNASSSSGVVYGAALSKLFIIGSTFRNNSGASYADQLRLMSGQTQLMNTVLWNDWSGTSVYLGGTASLLGSNSLVQGVTVAGANNLSGSTDPLLRLDGCLLPGSPLLGAGVAGPYSSLDQQLEARGTPPDVGADQWVDVDTDGLPDAWELEVAGTLTALAGGDADGDAVTDIDEYACFDGVLYCEPLDADTDGDLAPDGVEFEYGTNPLVSDSDALTSDLNQDGIIDGIGIQLGYLVDTNDDDGDGVSNADELAMGTDPLLADTDGDLVSDADDDFPLDPNLSTLPSDPEDETAPTITLILPTNASEL